MADDYFISYSSVDGADFALKLADDLQAGPPVFPAWLDKRKLHAGIADWDVQVFEAIKNCKCLLFVMTQDSIDELSVAKDEWTFALRYKKPVIPLRLHRVELPPLMGRREYVSFTDDYDTAIARLRRELQWLDSPDGVLAQLKFRRADADRSLRRASDPNEIARIRQDIAQLDADIQRQKEIVANPDVRRLYLGEEFRL
jgi:hypothetical protein